MKHYFIIPLFMLSTNALAMFCPTNFGQINLGDKFEFVIKQCGKPDEEKSNDITSNPSQIWSYFVKTNPQDSNTTSQMNIAFNDDKVVNITVNAASTDSTSFCGTTIKIGDASQAIEKACGKAFMINQSNQNSENDANAKTTKTTTIRYNGPPPTTFVFTDGVLTARQ